MSESAHPRCEFMLHLVPFHVWFARTLIPHTGQDAFPPMLVESLPGGFHIVGSKCATGNRVRCILDS